MGAMSEWPMTLLSLIIFYSGQFICRIEYTFFCLPSTPGPCKTGSPRMGPGRGGRADPGGRIYRISEKGCFRQLLFFLTVYSGFIYNMFFQPSGIKCNIQKKSSLYIR